MFSLMLLHMNQIFSSLRGHLHFSVHFFFTFVAPFYFLLDGLFDLDYLILLDGLFDLADIMLMITLFRVLITLALLHQAFWKNIKYEESFEECLMQQIPRYEFSKKRHYRHDVMLILILLKYCFLWICCINYSEKKMTYSGSFRGMFAAADPKKIIL